MKLPAWDCITLALSHILSFDIVHIFQWSSKRKFHFHILVQFDTYMYV